MNNQHGIPEKTEYAIKVNKKDLNNNTKKANNYHIISNNKNINSEKMHKINTYIPLHTTKPLQNYVNNSIIPPYSNDRSLPINHKIILPLINANILYFCDYSFKKQFKIFFIFLLKGKI
jgi:hypothetical protein